MPKACSRRRNGCFVFFLENWMFVALVLPCRCLLLCSGIGRHDAKRMPGVLALPPLGGWCFYVRSAALARAHAVLKRIKRRLGCPFKKDKTEHPCGFAGSLTCG